MNLIFNKEIEESKIILTDFSCADGRAILKKTTFYKIIWTVEENFKIYIDGCITKLEKNQLLFCTPLNIIEFFEENHGITSLVFNREFYCIRDNDDEVSCNGFLFYGSSSPVIINLQENKKADLQNLFNTFKTEFLLNDSLQGQMLRSLLVQLLIRSNRLLYQKVSKLFYSQGEIDLIRKFNILVEKHYKTHHKVVDYASMMAKSPKTISNIFTKFSKRTPLAIINERINLEAKRLLLFSNQPICEISAQLGYKHESHFSIFFKKHNDFTPLKFRVDYKNDILVRKNI